MIQCKIFVVGFCFVFSSKTWLFLLFMFLLFFLIISTGSAESCQFHFLYNLLFFLIRQQFFDLSLYLHMFGLERTWRVIKITMLSRRIHMYIRITLNFRSSCHHLECLDHRCAPPCSQFMDSCMLGKHSTNCAPSPVQFIILNSESENENPKRGRYFKMYSSTKVAQT